MKKFLVLFVSIIFYFTSFATHNRAGYIVYEHVSGYTYKFYIWTFTYTLSPADRDSLPVWWGDSTASYVHRVQYWYLPDYYKKNLYIAEHTFPGPGTYEIVMQDPNRNEGVINIANSVNTVFAIKTVLHIDPFLGYNNSIKMSNYPLDKAALGQLFIHNPGAYDIDGDSLVYKLDTCRYNGGKKIPWFRQPDYSDTLYVNPHTGDFVWNAPTRIGKYNVAIRVEEWRKGVKIGFVLQDMQIEVQETDNHQPKIHDIPDICVEAGDTIDFQVIADDQDNDSLKLWATGYPFLLSSSPAAFFNDSTVDTVYGQGKVVGEFRWVTNCTHVRTQPYLVTFKVQDDNPEVSLVDYQSVNIKVVPPGTKLLEIQPSNQKILLKWAKSCCTNCEGYEIYRTRMVDNHDTVRCQTGIPASWNYVHIADVKGREDTIFVDDNDGKGLTQGFSYCYRVVPIVNNTPGYASNHLCTELIEGIPIIVKASVSTTDSVNGAIDVQWLKPLNLDTISTPPPYRYYLYYSRDLYGSNYQGPIIFNGLNNTSYIDTNVNTVRTPSIYKIEIADYDSLTGQWQKIGNASVASTPFLKLIGTDRKVIVNIEQNVPWLIDREVIYRLNDATGQFDSIGQTSNNVFVDRNVINGNTYTYKVKVIGFYTADSLPRPLVNWSQVDSVTAIDTVPPACPIVALKSVCDSNYNVISWHMPSDSCLIDVANFKIYYTDNLDSAYRLIATLPRTDTMYVHYPTQTLAGCYIVKAIDSAGNVSNCDRNCIDICKYYKLPNVFTPNGDGVNDIFHPLPYRYVDHINIKIYDRWGDLVYQTTNPDINWDGTDMRTGKPVPDGIYYYICDVYEKRLTGIEPRNISGFIHVFRNPKNRKQ